MAPYGAVPCRAGSGVKEPLLKSTHGNFANYSICSEYLFSTYEVLIVHIQLTLNGGFHYSSLFFINLFVQSLVPN